jgi:glycosyltransferase involved in cell wall biosynthesis
MLRLTALIHTHNDALRLGRCLETVYPCDEIVVVDHGSVDRTMQIAREYGARVLSAEGAAPQANDRGWILCLDPHESLTEGLAASLFEWKLHTPEARAFSMSLREETAQGWVEHSAMQPRLVPAGWQRWQGHLPANEAKARVLEGELLRFAFP